MYMFRLLLISTCLICSAVSADTPVANEDFKLLASDAASGERFGRRVAIDGNNAIVGNADSVYFFYRAGSEWVEKTKFSSSVPGFGKSISISGSRAVVGANEGAYIYRLIGGNWSYETMLTSGSGQSDDSFGSQVAIDGLTAIVGAPHDDENGDEAGAAYVFMRDGGSWIRTKILASDGEGGWDGCHCADLFGSSVAISNDRVIIGATGAGNHYGWNDSGAAYIYQYDGSTWAETKLIPSVCDVESNQFGYSVSISGNKAIVGAYLCNMAVLYHFDGSDWVESQTMWGTSDNPSPSISFYFGISVSISGNIAIVGEDSEEQVIATLHTYISSKMNIGLKKLNLFQLFRHI